MTPTTSEIFKITSMIKKYFDFKKPVHLTSACFVKYSVC